MEFKIPSKLLNKLQTNPSAEANLKKILDLYRPLVSNRDLYFFSDYTDHGLNHINDVLESAERLISDDSFPLLTANDVSILIHAILMHDIGMHISSKLFRQLIQQNQVLLPEIDKQNWKQLWENYLAEAFRFSDTERMNISGSLDKIESPNLDNLSEIDRKVIGEFLRRYHPRLCHEIAIGAPYLFFNEEVLDGLETPGFRYLAGFVGRSHGMNLRNTLPILQKKYTSNFKNPYGVKIIYLMAIVRIADYLQIQKERAPLLLYRIRDLKSPFSNREWQLHQAIEHVDFGATDPERIDVQCNPTTVSLFLKLENLLNDIQDEMDKSWAVLGEIYSGQKFGKLGLSFRRIVSDIDTARENVPFLPRKLNFYSDSEILKQLIKPLYNNDPACGIRELLQNALDACKERKYREGDNYTPEIKITIAEEKGQYKFVIQDNGIGMNENILSNYFLKAGGSFRDSSEWVKMFSDKDRESQIVRTGRFGVGALSAFLLGIEIEVSTRHIDEDASLSFNTAYNQGSIEVYKTYGEPIGTIVTIKLNSHLNDLLKRSHYYKLDWLKYYLADNPEVKYYFNKHVKNVLAFPKNMDKEPVFPKDHPEWRHFTHKKMDFYWTFNSQRWHQKPNKKYDKVVGKLTCNGFSIPNGYQINNSEWNWETPRVAIIDRSRNLGLSLDRNSVYNNQLPEERNFLTEVCEEMVAEILAAEFIERYGLKYLAHTFDRSVVNNLRAHIFCHQKGYVFNTFSCFNNIKEMEHHAYEFWLSSKNEGDMDLSEILSNNTFYIAIDKPEIDNIDSLAEASSHFNGLELWFTPGNNTSINSKTIVQYLAPYLKPAAIRHEFYLGRYMKVDAETLNFPAKSIQISALRNHINSFLAVRHSVAKLVNQNPRECIFFQEIQMKYLGHHPIIPFDFNERKNVYPLAFEKLADKIQWHRNRLSNK